MFIGVGFAWLTLSQSTPITNELLISTKLVIQEEEMTRGRGRNPLTGLERSMTVGEREDIKMQKAEAESTLKHITDNPNAVAEGIDKVKLKREIDRYDAILHAGTPPRVSGIRKDGLVQEANRLKEEMQKNMPTAEEMAHPAKNPGAVQKHLMWEKRNLQNIQRFKEIQRTLEPDDPTATNIDRLRREK